MLPKISHASALNLSNMLNARDMLLESFPHTLNNYDNCSGCSNFLFEESAAKQHIFGLLLCHINQKSFARVENFKILLNLWAGYFCWYKMRICTTIQYKKE